MQTYLISSIAGPIGSFSEVREYPVIVKAESTKQANAVIVRTNMPNPSIFSFALWQESAYRENIDWFEICSYLVRKIVQSSELHFKISKLGNLTLLKTKNNENHLDQ